MKAPRRRRALGSLASVVALAAIAAACSSSSSGDDGAPSSSGQTAATTPSSGPTGPIGATVGPPMGVKFDQARVDTYLPTLKQMGGGWTFAEVVWCDLERNEGQPYAWEATDAALANATAAGFSFAIKLRVGSCWATGGRLPERGKKTASAEPLDLARYDVFVKNVVERYSAKGVHVYAVENEPNAPVFWTGDATAYGALVERAAGVVRANDARAVVVDGGVSSTGYGAPMAARLLANGQDADAVAAYNRYYERRFQVRQRDFPKVSTAGDLRSALEGDQVMRNQAFLDTTFDLARRKVIDVMQVHFYERWDAAPDLVAYLRAELPPQFPFEVWELGQFWPDADPSDDALRAQEVLKVASVLLGAGARRLAFLPAAFDPNGRRDSELRWGLFDPTTGEARASGRAWVALSALTAADGAQWQALEGRSSGLAITSGSGTAIVAWSASGQPEKVALPSGIQQVAGDGSTSAAPSTLTVDDAPVILDTRLTPQDAISTFR